MAQPKIPTARGPNVGAASAYYAEVKNTNNQVQRLIEQSRAPLEAPQDSYTIESLDTMTAQLNRAIAAARTTGKVEIVAPPFLLPRIRTAVDNARQLGRLSEMAAVTYVSSRNGRAVAPDAQSQDPFDQAFLDQVFKEVDATEAPKPPPPSDPDTQQIATKSDANTLESAVAPSTGSFDIFGTVTRHQR